MPRYSCAGLSRHNNNTVDVAVHSKASAYYTYKVRVCVGFEREKRGLERFQLSAQARSGGWFCTHFAVFEVALLRPALAVVALIPCLDADFAEKPQTTSTVPDKVYQVCVPEILRFLTCSAHFFFSGYPKHSMTPRSRHRHSLG